MNRSHIEQLRAGHAHSRENFLRHGQRSDVALCDENIALCDLALAGLRWRFVRDILPNCDIFGPVTDWDEAEPLAGTISALVVNYGEGVGEAECGDELQAAVDAFMAKVGAA